MCIAPTVREGGGTFSFSHMPTGGKGVSPGQVTAGMHMSISMCVFVSMNNPPCCAFSRCARKEKCERSSEPRRFASDIKQCVRLSVHPNNISVSQFSVTVSGKRIHRIRHPEIETVLFEVSDAQTWCLSHHAVAYSSNIRHLFFLCATWKIKFGEILIGSN